MKYRIARLIALAVFAATPVFAQQTQPVAQTQKAPQTQAQTQPQTQSFKTTPSGALGINQGKATQSQKSLPDGRQARPLQFRMEFGMSFASFYESWSSPSRRGKSEAHVAYAAGGGVFGENGFLKSGLQFTPNAQNRNIAVSFSAGKMLGRLGPVRAGAGVKYWYVKETQERFRNQYLQLYVRDRRHIGLFAVHGAIGRFNSDYGSLSALFGTAYGSTKSFVVTSGGKKSENMLDDSLVPAYGAELALVLRQDKIFSFSGNILWLRAMSKDWSGDYSSDVVPRDNLVVSGTTRYRLPIKLLGGRTHIIATGAYVNEHELLIEKTGLKLLLDLEW